MDGGNIRCVVIALLLKKSQMLLGFLEIHFDCPSHRIKFQYSLRCQTDSACVIFLLINNSLSTGTNPSVLLNPKVKTCCPMTHRPEVWSK